MKINMRNYNRIMKIDDLSIRKEKLESMCLSIDHHGAAFYMAMDEIKRLNEMGILTPLQKAFKAGKF